MAYNRKNILYRIADIQAIYKMHSKNHRGGCTDKYIFHTLIYPNYRISRSTFYSYLTVNTVSELKKIEAAEKQQTQLQLF